MKMNSRELNEKIVIQELKVILDAGREQKTYIDKYRVRAKKKTVSTKEFISNNSNFTSLTLKFIIRKRDINSDYFVLYKNDIFNIKHVHEFEDGLHIELTVEKVS